MKEIKHGVRATYNFGGCRCDKCTAANSAHVYAQRKVAGWDEPIGRRVSVEEGSPFGAVTVPAAVLAQAINNLAKDIKTEALSLLWHMNHK